MRNKLGKSFPYNYNNYALFIIGINFFVFLLTNLRPGLLVNLAMNPVLVVKSHAYWQFVTYMFAHANMQHIFFNMIGLFFFGFQVERRMGSSEFLLFYFFCGIAAGIFSFIFYYILLHIITYFVFLKDNSYKKQTDTQKAIQILIKQSELK